MLLPTFVYKVAYFILNSNSLRLTRFEGNDRVFTDIRY